MKVSSILFALPFFLSMSSLYAQPPKPEEGFRWMLNEQYSDEFNGTELDLEKWYDYHPFWEGRPPARFEKTGVSVKDGMLQLKNRKKEGSQPGDKWTIEGAAVVSRSITAHFGYYECSQLASKIRMSSTFWMSNRGAPGPDPCGGDRYSQELDIQESVGGNGSGNPFTNSMHSNTHYKYTDCNGNVTTYSVGSQIPLVEGEVSDTFHVYAAHWKNSKSVDFYLDGQKGNSVAISTAVDPTPFERPMHINMVTETYDWVTPPLDADLADDSRNTTYIDWVRSWIMVPVDFRETESDLIQNGGFESGNFDHWTGWGGNPLEVVMDHAYSGNYAAHIVGPGAPEYVVNLRKHASYTLSCYGKVTAGSGAVLFGIKDTEENVLGSVQVSEEVYTQKSFEFTTGASGLGLKFYFYAPNSGVEGYADDFSLVLNDPADTLQQEEIPIFEESIFFEEQPGVLPTGNTIQVLLGYKANGDRKLRLKLFNPDSILVGESEYPALAGYGLKKVDLRLDSIPPAGKEYTFVAELFYPDSALADPIHIDFLSTELQNPIDITVKVLDLRNDMAIDAADVRLNDREGQSGADGTIVFTDIPPGEISLEIEKEGFNKLSYFAEIASDTVLELRLVPLSRFVSIILSDSYTGEPVEDALIKLGSQQLLSDFNGTARFDTYSGNYSLRAVAQNYYPFLSDISIGHDTSISISLQRSHADLKFVVKNEGSYLHRATVSIADTSLSTSTVGVTFIEGLETDTTYTFTISHEDIGLFEDSLVLFTDSTLRINLGTSGIEFPGGAIIRLYPNPASKIVYLSGLQGPCRYNISNMLGSLVGSGIVDPSSAIDVSGLKEGIYFLQIENRKPLKLMKR